MPKPKGIKSESQTPDLLDLTFFQRRGGATRRMVSQPLVVIKLGGSALTDKTRIYTPRVHTIRQAAKEIAEICRTYSVILIHGAGSFGHIPVRKYRLEHGLSDLKQLRGLATTKTKLLEWEAILDEEFLKHEVPIVPIFPSDFVVTRNGRIFSAELKPLQKWLGMGCVPIVGGDIVPDSELGFSVLSGDQLAAYLAVKLKAKRLVFAADVDGVFDVDPKVNPQAKLLRELSGSSASRLIPKATSRTASDVTGGMAGKVREALVVSRAQIPVYFVNLTKSGRLRRAALGRRVVSSRISGS